MIADTSEDQYYGVEVSGWNSSENFFVEKTSLEWTPDGSKSVRVKADIRQGTIIFLRLLQGGAATIQFPVAYQTTQIGSRDREGLILVSLQQMHPRKTREPFAPQELSPAF
jgi:hypothetical protein